MIKRVIKVLVVTALIAVILATSITPALARPSRFGKELNTDRPCEVHSSNAQQGRGARHVNDPDPPLRTGCWVVLPGQG